MPAQTKTDLTEILDHSPLLTIQQTEYKRLLGYPSDVELKERAVELCAMTKEWYEKNGEPWVYSRQAESFELKGDHILINGVTFTSRRLSEQLKNAGAHSVFVVAVCAGKGCENQARELWLEEKPDEYFFMEMYGSAVVENLITNTGARICAWADQNNCAVLPHYSPGYPEWPVTDQQKLFGIISQNGNSGLPEELFVMDSGMLNPKKSLLAVFGITKELDRVRKYTELVPCENCSLQACPYRRVPYKRMPEHPKKTTAPKLNDHQQRKYSVNPRALEKWANERLTFNDLSDEKIVANFRFEGTTCSNMGRSLEFDYTIILGPVAEELKILETHCKPSEGDTGHTSMCQYLKSPEALMTDIENEIPLIGKPLEHIFEWKFSSNPSGCYCTPSAREHKWALVLQVLHFALVKKGII